MISNRLQVTLSFLLLSLFTFSQSNTLVVFSEDPTPFYVVLDGVKKNQAAETRVTIPGIEQTNSSVKIFFEDESLAPVSKTIWWDEEHRNDEVTFRLVPTKKGYKLRFFSTKLRTPNPVSSNTPPPSNATQTIPQQNVQSTTTTTVTETTSVNAVSDSNIEDGSVNMNINMNDATSTDTGSDNMNMSMNINMNDQMDSSTESDNVSMSMNINLNDGFSDASNDANSTMNVNMNVNDNSGTMNTENTSSDFNNTNTAVNETVTTTTVTTTTINETPVESSLPVSSGCNNPVQDMSRIMGALDEESFDDGKMMVAKQATSKSCMTVDQIKQIMEEFSFSKNRVEFAKYGYDRCYNPDDYYQVNSSFDFSSEKEELNDYIQSRKRD
jgi:hypothetical protein